jgi:DNA-binding IclR family transcriptional regulator
VQSVERALTVLQALAAKAAPMSLAALERQLGLHKSILFRLLRTLESSGFVERDSETGWFQLGLGALEIGQAYTHGNPLLRVSTPSLQTMVDDSPHTSYLGILRGFDMVYLASIEGRGPLRVHAPAGSRLPAHAAAFGKILLAELDEDEVRRLAAEHGLAALTAKTVTDVEKLIRQLRRARRQGFALNSEESYLGIGSVGAPVRDVTGTAVASVSLSYATSLVPSAELPKWIERTLAAASEISSKLDRVVVPHRVSSDAYPRDVEEA